MRGILRQKVRIDIAQLETMGVRLRTASSASSRSLEGGGGIYDRSISYDLDTQ